MKTFCCGFLLALLFALPAFAQDPDEIGVVRTLSGTATIQRGNASIPATVGLALHRSDVVHTGNPGALGLVLNDDTTFSLGSNSELSLSNYAFDPRESQFALIVRLTKGTFSYVSGLIGKLSPDSIRLQMPEATIAVRGTKLLIDIKE
jgi:hypothetical protein